MKKYKKKNKEQRSALDTQVKTLQQELEQSQHEAMEAEAVSGAQQGVGRKRTIQKRSPARGNVAAKMQRATDHSMETEATDAAADARQSGFARQAPEGRYSDQWTPMSVVPLCCCRHRRRC